MDHVVAANTANKDSFIKHVFNFDQDSKGEMMNIIQYCILAMIPIALLASVIDYMFPKIDKTKGSLELVVEALGQLCVTFMVLVFFHRIMTYFSTWSGLEHTPLNFPSLIILFLLLAMSWRQGKVGKKLHAVSKRVLTFPRDNYWDPDTKKHHSKKNGNVVKVTQPLSRGGILPPPIATKQKSIPAQRDAKLTDYMETQKQIAAELPTDSAPRTNNQVAASGEVGVYPSYQNMYANGAGADGGSLGGAGQEPMTANEAMGSGFGAAW